MQRTTRQRTAVAELLAGLEDFHSAQDIHRMLGEQGTAIGLATVYRTVQGLADAGEIDVLRSPDGEFRYRRCIERAHHHHLVCRGCGRTVELAADDVEAWAASIAATHGFSDVEHTVELFGTCAECAA